jgi:hypothetical protein
VLLTLIVFRGLRERIRSRFGRQEEMVTFALSADADTKPFVEALHALEQVRVRSLQVDPQSDRTVVIAGLRTDPGVKLDPVLAELAHRDDVDSFSLQER